MFGPVDFLRVFRMLAMAEAVSWVLLIIATIVKYAMGQEGGVHILDPVHGALFVAYVFLALVLRRKNEWTSGTLTIVLVDSVLRPGAFGSPGDRI